MKMKKTLILIMAASALASCKSDPQVDKAQTPHEGTVVLRASVWQPDTRMGVSEGTAGLSFEWEAGTDFIGLFATDETGAIGQNRMYSAESAGPVSDFKPETAGDAIFWGEGEHDFYAYYPYNADAGSDITQIPVSLPAAQTQTGTSVAHIAPYNFIYAVKEGAAQGGSVELGFSHIFSVLNIKVSSSTREETLNSIKFRCTDANEAVAFSAGTFDFTSGEYSVADGENNEITLTFAEPVTVGSTPFNAYMLITPGHEGKTFEVVAVTDDTETVIATKEAPPAGGLPTGRKIVVSGDLNPVPADTYADLIGTWELTNNTATYNNPYALGTTFTFTEKVENESYNVHIDVADFGENNVFEAKYEDGKVYIYNRQEMGTSVVNEVTQYINLHFNGTRNGSGTNVWVAQQLGWVAVPEFDNEAGTISLAFEDNGQGEDIEAGNILEAVTMCLWRGANNHFNYSIPLGTTQDMVLVKSTSGGGTEPEPGDVTDLSANGTANTYLVTEANTSYKFKATVMGNGTPRTYTWDNGNKTVSYTDAEIALNPVSALVLWYNCYQPSAWVNEEPVVVSSVKLEDGYIYFNTPAAFVNGNAVIAVFDEDVDYDTVEADANGLITNANILWSWNIWAVEGYDPATNEKRIQTTAGHTIMDRNLGALIDGTTIPSTNTNNAAGEGYYGATSAIGNYYQWGRKDPFPYFAGTSHYSNGSNNLDFTPTYTPIAELRNDSQGTGTPVDGQIFKDQTARIYNYIDADLTSPLSKSIDKATLNPHKLISGTYWWKYTGDGLWRYLWGNPITGNYSMTDAETSLKSIYDPCPVGWRVWTNGAYLAVVEEFAATASIADNKYGLIVNNSMFPGNGGSRASNLNNFTYYLNPTANGNGGIGMLTSASNTYDSNFMFMCAWTLNNAGYTSFTMEIPSSSGSNIKNGDRASTLRCMKDTE